MTQHQKPEELAEESKRLASSLTFDTSDSTLFAVDELCAAIDRLAALGSAQQRPDDDLLWDKTLKQRDDYHEAADKLAATIGNHLGIDIGEHSSDNDPWRNAYEAIASAQQGEQWVRCRVCGTPDTVERARHEIHTTQAQQGEPVAWMWQHDETGRTGFVDALEVEYGWQEQNPRLRLLGPLYTAPVAAPEAPDANSSTTAKTSIGAACSPIGCECSTKVPEAPEERKPLTEEEIYDGYAAKDTCDLLEAYFEGVRFAEAAHGIKP